MHSDLLEPQISLQSNSNQPFHTSAMAGNKAQRGKGKKTGYIRNPAPRPDDPESIDHLQDRGKSISTTGTSPKLESRNWKKTGSKSRKREGS